MTAEPSRDELLAEQLSLRTRLCELEDALQRSGLSQDEFTRIARRIFDRCCELTGARSGYVALLSPSGEENEVLFLEAGGQPCSVDPTLPMPMRGLRAEACARQEAVYENDFQGSSWNGLQRAGLAALANVLFAPLPIGERVKGLIGLANKPGGFDEGDRAVAAAFGDVAAAALEDHLVRGALERSEERLGAIVGSVSDCMILLDEELRILWANQKAIEARGEIVGRRCHEVWFGSEQRCEPCLAARTLLDGGDHEGELLLPGRDGETRLYFVTSRVAARHADGRPRLLVETSRDITQQRRLELQLRQAQKMEAIGTLAGGIAHDFNNLLQSILGHAQLAHADPDVSERIRGDLEEVIRGSRRAKQLVEQILAYARATEKSVETLSLEPLVEEALQLLRASLPASVALEVSLDPGCGPVRVDPTRVHQLVMNLCANAEHAMRPAGGLLGVRLEQRTLSAEDAAAHLALSARPYAVLSVRDSGCGMDARTLERALEPYFTTKELGEGTGLGLSVVHSIAQEHGGAVTIDSAPGSGTTVSVYLPLCNGADPGAGSRPGG